MTAAEAGASSSSQKLAARATTTAPQLRTPNAQALAGTPAKLKGGVIAVVVMESSWETAGAPRGPGGRHG